MSFAFILRRQKAIAGFYKLMYSNLCFEMVALVLTGTRLAGSWGGVLRVVYSRSLWSRMRRWELALKLWTGVSFSGVVGGYLGGKIDRT